MNKIITMKVAGGVGALALLSGCGVTINTAHGSSAHPASPQSSSPSSQQPRTTASQSGNTPASSSGSNSSVSAASSSPTSSTSPTSSETATSQSTSVTQTQSSSAPSSSSGVHTAVDPQTGWTTGIWYPNRGFAPIAFRIPLPTIRGPFESGPSPYRRRGWYWVGSGNMQVAISLVSTPLTDFSLSSPSGDQLLVSGGNTGANAMIWQNDSNGTIDANELVSLGTVQRGWPSAFGGPILQDHTFLMNITASDTPANLVLAEKMLARWSVADTNDGATFHTANSRWMPSWPLNPVQNSNYSALPYWIKAPGSYQ